MAISITVEAVGSEREQLEAAFIAAAQIEDERRNSGRDRSKIWIELPADMYFRARTNLIAKDRPVTVLEALLQRFPEVAGVRVAGRDQTPLRPSILEVAPRWAIEKKPSMPDLCALMVERWHAQAQQIIEQIIEQTPVGHFALFSAPALEGGEMRFRLAYLPAAMLPTRDSPLAGLDPALQWHAGPVRHEAVQLDVRAAMLSIHRAGSR